MAPEARPWCAKVQSIGNRVCVYKGAIRRTGTIEPTVLRELSHKGTAEGDGSYSAEFIG